MILFTPLLTFDTIFDSILHSRHEGFLVIGDKDHQYNAGQIDQLYKTNLQIEVVKKCKSFCKCWGDMKRKIQLRL